MTWVRLAYVPQSGQVLVVVPSDPPGLWAYDVDADAWQRIAANVSGLADVGDARFMAWDPSVERIVAYGPNDCTDCAGGDHAILVDPRTGAWTRATAITPDLRRGYYEPGGEIAYDESAQQTVVFVRSRDVMMLIAYDATADRWETLWSSASAMFEERTDTLAPDPGPRLHHWMVYDAVNKRIVVAGGERDTSAWVPANDVWAFDTATRQWTELLASNSP